MYGRDWVPLDWNYYRRLVSTAPKIWSPVGNEKLPVTHLIFASKCAMRGEIRLTSRAMAFFTP